MIRSRDGGQTWHEIRNGLPEVMRGNIEAMGLHEWNGGITLFAGSATGEVYSSEDQGDSWSLIAAGLPAISKVQHYMSFVPPEERAALMASTR